MTERELPAPLVPAEVDLTGLGFMPLKHLRVMQSTLFIKSTGDEFKAAFALWCKSWTEIPAGSLPNDDELLAALSQAKSWKKVRDRALHGWIACSDGRLYHRVIAPLAIDAWERREDFREVQDNKESRQQRWREKLKRLSALLREAGFSPPSGATLKELTALCAKHVDGFVDVDASTGETPGRPRETGKTVTVTVTETGTKSKPRKAAADPKAARGERLAPDWLLPKPWGEWSLGEYPHWTPETVRKIATGFRNHWVAKSGKDATKLDWYATWQNWCSSSITQRDFPPPKGAPAGVAARNAEAKKMLGIGSPEQGVIDA